VFSVITEILLDGKKIRLNPKKSIGKGGEADIFDIGGGLALKIFKTPDHPDLIGEKELQKFAARKIAEHQKKLPAFPKNLPPNVVTPRKLAYLTAGKTIAGYAMNLVSGADVLLRFSERQFRQSTATNSEVVKILGRLHEAVREIHNQKVVIGDFNDLNVLVRGEEIFLVDADSFQFGPFLSATFTDRFVDPLLCDPRENQLILAKAHNPESDWYAFAVMLMQSFLFVGPYGGVFRPKDPAQNVPHHLRPLRRITVFHPEVRYPKPAVPFPVLPDDLLHYFHEVFEKDRRGAFPEKFLEDLRWTVCSVCQTEHARSLCPNCLHIAPAAVKTVVSVRGSVTATRVFRTRGKIVCSAYQNGKLLWLTYEDGSLKRENGESILSLGKIPPRFRFRLRGDRTFIGQEGQVAVIRDGKVEKRLAVDCFGNLPIFDTNTHGYYWIEAGQLLREDQLGPKYLGDVLQGQTLFWVGPEFGFGFYRAGGISSAFVFDAKRTGINDRVKLSIPPGQLIDATCVFSESSAWFLLSLQESGKRTSYCFLVSREGKVLAQEKSEDGEMDWLEKIRGKCAAGKFLFSPTDDGIMRLEEDNGKISVTRVFPDTEPFVSSDSQLFAGKEGIYVVGQHEIQLLKIT
jgi:hypothetical protein